MIYNANDERITVSKNIRTLSAVYMHGKLQVDMNYDIPTLDISPIQWSMVEDNLKERHQCKISQRAITPKNKEGTVNCYMWTDGTRVVGLFDREDRGFLIKGLICWEDDCEANVYADKCMNDKEMCL